MSLKFNYSGKCEKVGEKIFFYDADLVNKITYNTCERTMYNIKGNAMRGFGRSADFKLENGLVEPIYFYIEKSLFTFLEDFSLETLKKALEIGLFPDELSCKWQRAFYWYNESSEVMALNYWWRRQLEILENEKKS